MAAEPAAKLVAEAIADSAVALGIRDSTNTIADEIQGLITLPFDWFRQHSNWPSGLTDCGVPFEFSVAIHPDTSASIRYAFDCTHHGRGVAGNWTRYLDYAARVTSLGPLQLENLWSLLGRHLDGIPPSFRTPLLCGVGYGANGQRRASLYFNTRWMSHTQVKQRLTNSENLLSYVFERHGSFRPLEGVAYDFDDGHQDPVTVKTYVSFDLTKLTTKLSDVAGYHPDLYAASEIFERFFSSNKPYLMDRSLLLQTRIDQNSSRHREKVLFLCPGWGWDQPQGLAELLSYLTQTFQLNLQPLHVVLRVFREYEIILCPSFVAVGPGRPHPSITFYFCPIIDTLLEPMPLGDGRHASQVRNEMSTGVGINPLVGRDPNREILDQMLSDAVNYLLSKRKTDGHWSDFRLDEPDGRWVDYPLAGRSDEWTTAYIGSILSTNPAFHKDLTCSIEWLQKRFRRGAGWGWNKDTEADADSTALAILTLRQTGAVVPEGAWEALLRYRLPDGGYRAYVDWNLDYERGDGAPELTSCVLLAQLSSGLAESGMIHAAVGNLISMQREDGGWNAFWWKHDLFATHRVLRALNAVIEFAKLDASPTAATLTELAADRAQAGRRSVGALAITNEPFILGLWLSSWFAAQGSVYHTSAYRILRNLNLQQQRNGRWLAVPIKRIARTKLLRQWARSDAGKLYLDLECLITTATVIEGLLALRRALKAGRSGEPRGR
jgi:hypothetical protein